MRRIVSISLTLLALAAVSLALSGCVVVPPRHHDRVWVPGYWGPSHVWVGGYYR